MSNIILTGRRYLLYYGVIQPKGALAGAPAAGENACRIRLRSPRPAFFSLSNRSAVSKTCAIIMFFMPVCLYSSPNLNFTPWSPLAGEHITSALSKGVDGLMQPVPAHNNIYRVHIGRLDLSSRARRGQMFSLAAGPPPARPRAPPSAGLYWYRIQHLPCYKRKYFYPIILSGKPARIARA
jgi:hypothetical protein